jgi:opacity protein-like surface antigen
MKTARTCVAVIASFLLVGALTASAEAPKEEFGGNGFYTGIGVALGWENFQGPVGIPTDTGVGVDFWGGYRFMKFLAVEGQLQWIQGITAVDVQPLSYTANLKAYLPLGRFQPFALVGVGGLSVFSNITTGSTTDFMARFGAGSDVYLTKNIALTVTWNYLYGTGSLSGFQANTLTLGAQYKF